MKNLILILTLSFYLSLSGQIAASFENFKQSKALEGAALGVSLMEVNTGNVIFESNGSQFFYPASVQKTITTGAALALLGSDFAYQTKVYYTGTIEGGKLNGNLIIEGSGDPTSNSKHFNNDILTQVLSKLKALGVNEIKGKLIIVNDKNAHNTPQTWLFEDIGNYYGVAPQLFNYKENMYTISFQQQADGLNPSIKSIDVPVDYTFDLKLTCSSSDKGDHSFILGAPFSKEREIIGTISAGTSVFKVKGANSNPGFTFQKELNNQIPILNEQMSSENRKELCSVVSGNLKTICKVTNHESINLFAEGILNTLGLSFTNKYTTAAGIEIVENYIKQSKVDAKQIIIKDGSGLSPLNAMTPSFAANWMCDFYANKDFVSTLPVAGESGTLQYLNNVAIKGKVRAKSGSAEGMINYAGYLTKNNGEVLAFSIFVNNAYQSKYSIRREIGVFLESLL